MNLVLFFNIMINNVYRKIVFHRVKMNISPPAANKYKILFTTWETRKLAYFNKAIAINSLYCKRHGYDFKYGCTGYENIPPYWAKVSYVYDLMQANPGVDYIVWMDSDAVLSNQLLRLEQVINLDDMDKDLWISYDPNFSYQFIYYMRQIINTGVYVIRNNEEGKNFLKCWVKMYDPAKWKKKGHEWIGKGYYSGRNYEQGAFNRLVNSSKHFLQKTAILPAYYFADSRLHAERHYITHLMATNKDIVDKIFNKILQLSTDQPGTQ